MRRWEFAHFNTKAVDWKCFGKITEKRKELRIVINFISWVMLKMVDGKKVTCPWLSPLFVCSGRGRNMLLARKMRRAISRLRVFTIAWMKRERNIYSDSHTKLTKLKRNDFFPKISFADSMEVTEKLLGGLNKAQVRHIFLFLLSSEEGV